jgi:hypothetical protein
LFFYLFIYLFIYFNAKNPTAAKQMIKVDAHGFLRAYKDDEGTPQDYYALLDKIQQTLARYQEQEQEQAEQHKPIPMAPSTSPQIVVSTATTTTPPKIISRLANNAHDGKTVSSETYKNLPESDARLLFNFNVKLRHSVEGIVVSACQLFKSDLVVLYPPHIFIESTDIVNVKIHHALFFFLSSFNPK